MVGVFVVFQCILDVFWCILMYLYFPPKYIFACKIRKKTALKNLPRIREIHEEYILNTLEYTQIHSNTLEYSMRSRGSYRVFAVFRCILMYSGTHVFWVYSECILSVFWVYSLGVKVQHVGVVILMLTLRIRVILALLLLFQCSSHPLHIPPNSPSLLTHMPTLILRPDELWEHILYIMCFDGMVCSKYMRADAHMLEALAQADQFSWVPIALGALNTYTYVLNTYKYSKNTVQITYKYIQIHTNTISSIWNIDMRCMCGIHLEYW